MKGSLGSRFVGSSTVVFVCWLLAAWLPADRAPGLGPPPAAFFERVPTKHRPRAEAFYRKYLEVQGVPIVAAEVVDEEALWRAGEVVARMLAGRSDLLETMRREGMYVVIIGRNQKYTDIPEYSDHPNPEFINERVRGTGGRPTSFPEENLLAFVLDRYDDESIAVHEFAHTIDWALRRTDPQWSRRRDEAYRAALERGLWQGTYAASNAGEYWAELCQSFFDANRVNNWNHGPIGTREQLKAYDPIGYELVRSTLNWDQVEDWRYPWLSSWPAVTAPPAELRLDPFYRRFSWAREFWIVSRSARDEALREANLVVRHLFAYRHDVLKALIGAGVRLVVLGQKESVTDLPEYRGKKPGGSWDPQVRIVEYSRETPVLVLGEEYLLGTYRAVRRGDMQLIRLLAKALLQVTGSRPVDPDWERRPRHLWQQYELAVQRLDERFGQAVRRAYEAALAGGLWKGTAAVHGPDEYWAKGVLAYFDALGEDAPYRAGVGQVRTREALRLHDPALYELVHETFGYAGRSDWRFRWPFEPRH
jgi:hypothetical protein